MIVSMQEAHYSQTMKDHLTPTVITDKNGKTTTVYKKLFETPTSPWSTPPPPGGWPKPQESDEPRIHPYSKERRDNPIGTDEERAKTISAIVKVFSNRRELGPIGHILGSLEGCKDGDYLKRAQGAVESADDIDDLHFLSFRITSKETAIVDAAYAYRDLVDNQHPSRTLKSLIELHKNILKDYPRKMDENGGIKAIEAHLYAKDHASVPAGHKRMGAYAQTVDNEDYVALVEQYADSVHELVAYVSERGFEDFDHDHFAEYLSNGPIARGWL
jgi:hypothetical protein